MKRRLPADGGESGAVEKSKPRLCGSEHRRSRGCGGVASRLPVCNERSAACEEAREETCPDTARSCVSCLLCVGSGVCVAALHTCASIEIDKLRETLVPLRR